MINSKLIVLLQNFPKSNLNAFSKFIQSPFHNENQDLIDLFNLLEPLIRANNWNEKTIALINKEVIWKKLFKHQKYLDEQIRRLASDLTKKIYQFLSYQHFKLNTIDEIVYLLPTISAPSLNKHFSGVVRQANMIQKKSKLRNVGYHFSRFKLEYYQFVNFEKSQKMKVVFENLEKADYHLDCYYIFNKLKNYCDSLSYKKVVAKEPNIHLFPSFLKYLEDSIFLKEPCIKTYYLIMNMLLSPENESHFKNVKSLLEKESDRFTHNELNTIYIYLKNYCINTKINNGKSDYFWQLFDIFKTLLSKEIIFVDGALDPQDYKNIITVGCHIKEFDWTENFIQTYAQRLPKKSQDNDLSYNLAKVYFHKEEYEKVIEQLREVEYKNLNYTMGGKLMLLKTFYELKEINALYSLLDSYSIYLRRNKLISRNVQQQLMNGIRFTRKLSSLAPYDKKKIQKVKEQILNCKALASKKWLLEKVAELE